MFLDLSVGAEAQLEAIMADSARYNIGQVYRNINVPLFALRVLELQNVGRFKFKLAGRQDADDVAATRVSFDEEARPTLVRENDFAHDLPARGWMLIDPTSGAVLRTRLEFTLTSPSSKVEFKVRYRRDEMLGLWVPREMKEAYSTYVPGLRETRPAVEGRATYSKFRRFQVKTEEHIQVPK